MTETRTLAERLNDFGRFVNDKRTGKYGIFISDGRAEEYGVYSAGGRLIAEFPNVEQALARAETVIAQRDAFTGGAA